MKVDDAVDRYLIEIDIGKDVSDKTKRIRRDGLTGFVGWLSEKGVTDVTDVERRHIALFIEDLADEDDGYSYNTIMTHYFDSISAAFGFLYRDGIIENNPADRIKRSAIRSKAKGAMSEKEKKLSHGTKASLSKDEVYTLAEEAAPEPVVRNELLIKLMFWTGMRVSEVTTINIGEDGTLDGPGSDVYPDVPKIEYFSSKSDSRQVAAYPSRELNHLLRDYVSHGRLRYKYADTSDRLFLAQKGPITESGIQDMIRRAAENAGMNDVRRVTSDGREMHRVTPHILRHSAAMHYRNQEGVGLDDIQAQLGHSSSEITEEYYVDTEEERIIDVFGE